MKTTRLIFVAGAALALLAGCQTGPTSAPAANDGRITVNFQNPEKFTDFKDSFTGTDSGREAYMGELRRFLDREARFHLAEGQKLSVTFLDIDMAGDFLPAVARGHDDLRVVKDIYPPRIKLAFELTDAGGAVLAKGERNLTDLAFLSRVTLPQRDTLYYEEELLRDWLRGEFK